MRNLKNITEQKKLHLLSLQHELRQLQHNMANPTVLNDKHEEINQLKKEVEVLDITTDFSRGNPDNNLINRLNQLQRHYIEEQKFLHNDTQHSFLEKSETLLDIYEKMKTIESLKNKQQETEMEHVPDHSFLDDVD